MEKAKDVIVVTGATGHQGGAVARELVADGYRVRAMTRHPDSDAAKELKKVGAEVVEGDLDDPSSLPRVLDRAWGAFAVQNTWEAGVEKEEVQGKQFADAAKKAGVQHYVYSSVASAHRNTGIPHFDNKARVEQHVRGLGFPSTVILRPVFFMDNLTSANFKPGIDQGVLAMALDPDTKLQMIAVSDIGRYGKLAFEQHARLNGRAIDIAGDELTMPETAEIISRAAKHPVKHVRVPIEEIRKFSEDYALMLEWFNDVGYDADIAGNAKEFGIPPTKFANWAAQAVWG